MYSPEFLLHCRGRNKWCDPRHVYKKVPCNPVTMAKKPGFLFLSCSEALGQFAPQNFFWKEGAPSSRWQGEEMQFGLVQVTKSPQPSSPQVQFHTLQPFHELPTIFWEVMPEQQICRRILRDARMLQVVVLPFWPLIDEKISENVHVLTLQCLLAIKCGQKNHEQIHPWDRCDIALSAQGWRAIQRDEWRDVVCKWCH